MNTQDSLISRTIIVIDKYGYEDLSLRRLTGTLGLTTGAFYKHFKNKNDLYEKVAIELSKNFVNSIPLYKGASAKQQLLIIAKYFCKYVEQHTNLADFLFFNPVTLKVFSTKESKYDFLNKIGSLIHKLNRKSNISDHEFFIQIWSFIQGYAALIKNKIVKYDETLVEKTLNEFLK